MISTMLMISEIRGHDLKAGRLLAGLSIPFFAAVAGIGERSVERIEAGGNVWLVTRTAAAETLWGWGVRFVAHGNVQLLSGRVAPTVEQVGRFRGSRIRRAMWNLRMTRQQLIGLAQIESMTLTRMLNHRDLTAAPTAGFYRVIDVLERAGYAFAPWRHGRTGDRCLVARDRPGPRDWSMMRVAGWRAEGLGWPAHKLEEPGDES